MLLLFIKTCISLIFSLNGITNTFHNAHLYNLHITSYKKPTNYKIKHEQLAIKANKRTLKIMTHIYLLIK
jgi:hypothetical protein